MASNSRDELLVDLAQRSIQTRIQNGIYPPGTKLSTAQIAASLNISRTPVIAAINRLVAQGLAESIPHRGTIVKQLNLTLIRETIEVREMIELFAVDQIVKNIDFYPAIVKEIENTLHQIETLEEDNYEQSSELETKFHTAYISLCGNSRIIDFYKSNWSIGVVFFLFTRSRLPLYRYQESMEQHYQMIALSKQGDVQGTRDVVRKHSKIVKDTLDWLTKNNETKSFFL